MIAICTGILAIIGVALLLIPGTSAATTSGEDSSNITNSTLSPEPITMNPSNITTDNQTANRTDETPKSNTTSQGNLSRGIVITNTSISFPCDPNTRNLANGIVITNTSISFPCEVTVRFDSITLRNNHEYYPWSNDELDLSAFVQGNRIDLTEYSTRGEIHVGHEMPYTGLGDVSQGETIYFDPGTEVTVFLPDTQPLSIFTVGQEVDECGRIDFIEPAMESLRQQVLEAFKGPPLNWFEAISMYQNIYVPWYDLSVVCELGSDNDGIGNVNKVYEPPDYGAGVQEVGGDSADFTLRYTITAKRSE